MRDRGIYVRQGMMVSYVIVEGPEMLRERAKLFNEVEKEKIDSGHYIQSYIVPAFEGLFAVFSEEREEEIMETAEPTDQQELTEFMKKK